MLTKAAGSSLMGVGVVEPSATQGALLEGLVRAIQGDRHQVVDAGRQPFEHERAIGGGEGLGAAGADQQAGDGLVASGVDRLPLDAPGGQGSRRYRSSG